MTDIHDKPLKDLLDQFKKRFMTLLFDIDPSGIQPVLTEESLHPGFRQKEAFGSTVPVDDFMLHLVLLTGNEPKIAERMLIFNSLLRYRCDKPVMSMIAYTGDTKPSVQKQTRSYGLNYKLWLHDARDMSPDFFLSSEDPCDISFAILTGREQNKTSLIREILQSLRSRMADNPGLLKENIRKLEILSTLRSKKVWQQVDKEVALSLKSY